MFKNLHELTQKLNTEQACIDYLAAQRWVDGKAVCVYCGHNKCYRIEGGKRFKCANKHCFKRFHVTVGTIFHASNVPLVKWFMAVYIGTAHKKGISSYQLGKDLGVTQKTAWFMLHRIRHGMKDKSKTKFKGIIESDETYMALKYRSDFKGLTPEQIDYIQSKKNNTKSKGAVIGLAERETGLVKVVSFDENNLTNITNTVRENVEKRSILHTDESNLYNALGYEMRRETVKHSAKEWVKIDFYGEKIHTNTVENFWSVIKRGVHGIYHQISFNTCNHIVMSLAGAIIHVK